SAESARRGSGEAATGVIAVTCAASEEEPAESSRTTTSQTTSAAATATASTAPIRTSGLRAQGPTERSFTAISIGSTPAGAVLRRRNERRVALPLAPPGAVSSVGRAPARQAGGHWFEPSTAHPERPANAGLLLVQPQNSPALLA